MTKAYSYMRWSDPKQGLGDSKGRQTDSAEAYCKEHGLELVKTFIDPGLSGYSGANRKKGDLKSFLDLVEARHIEEGSYLLIDSMDRLSRLPLNEAAFNLLALANAGIVIVTINDRMKFDRNVDLPTMINAVLKMQAANDYSKELGRKVARGHSNRKQEARETGRIYTKTGPGWLILNEARTHWLKLDDRAEIVRLIFRLRLEGLGTHVIANRLNAAGIKPLGGGVGWHQAAVRELLKNRMVLGEYQPRFAKNKAPDGPPRIGYYGEGIIDPADFARAQAGFTNKKPGRGNGAKAFNNLFQGITQCSQCEGTVGVAIRPRDFRPLYVCRNTAPGMCCTNRNRYRVTEFENAILAHLSDVDLTYKPEISPELTALKAAQAARADVNRKIAILLDRLEDGDQDINERYHARKAERAALDAEIKRLEVSLEHTVERDPTADQKVIRDLRDDLKTLTGTALYDARARVSAAVKQIVDKVSFGEMCGERTATVWVLGGAKLYMYHHDSKFVSEVNLAGAIIDGAEADPSLMESFTWGDPRREERLRKLKRVDA